MVKLIFFALIVLCVVCLMLFATTTLTNGGVVYKTFATHPDVPPSGGLLVWAKTDGTMQTTNSGGTDAGMGGGSGGGATFDTYTNCSAWTPTTAGRICLNSTGASPFSFYDTGTAILAKYKDDWVKVPPAAATFTIQDAATATDTGTGGFTLTVPASASNNVGGAFKTWTPATGATVRMSIFLNTNYTSCGLALTNGTAYETLVIESLTTSSSALAISYWTNSSTFGSNAAGPLPTVYGANIWFRVIDVAGNRTWRMSLDGITFVQLSSESNTSGFVPTRVGVTCNSGTSAAVPAALVQSWTN